MNSPRTKLQHLITRRDQLREGYPLFSELRGYEGVSEAYHGNFHLQPFR